MAAHHHWYRICYEGAKTHLVSGAMRPDLLADLAARGHEPRDMGPEFPGVKRVNEWGLDLGGCIIVGEPKRIVRVDNLPLTVWAAQVPEIVVDLRHTEQRRFASGRPYYKHHGRWHCTVLSPRQHFALLGALTAIADESLAAWRAFDAARDRAFAKGEN